MEGKFRSIRFKIWRTLSLTLVIFFSSVLFLSLSIISKIRKDTIFYQIEMASKDFGYRWREREIVAELDMPWISEFKIMKNRETSEIKMLKPPGHRPPDIKREEAAEAIMENLIKTKASKYKKTLKNNGMRIFYILHWDEDSLDQSEKEAFIFFTMIPLNGDLNYVLILGVITLIFVSFFVSKIIAQKIANPILALEVFAGEVAKRNWKAQIPETDNDEIGLLAEALKQMKDSLKTAEQRDRQFLQSTSHDLKTPVMIIKGYAQSMIDGIKINSEKSEAEIIKIEAEKLERRISQLLKLNTISHSLEYNENWGIVRIDRVLNSLVSRFKVIKPELNWIVDLKEVEITGDPESLLIAFENIIENQLRFAKTMISVSMLKEDDSEKINIQISNDGPKFEIDDPNLLFEAYKKDREGKFGLGLSIARQVINSHNGEISALNIENGVEFRIKI